MNSIVVVEDCKSALHRYSEASGVITVRIADGVLSLDRNEGEEFVAAFAPGQWLATWVEQGSK